MISYIKGELTEIMEDAIVVENNGIGFNIRVPATVISEFCVTGEQVKVYTYLQIRGRCTQSLWLFSQEMTLKYLRCLSM